MSMMPISSNISKNQFGCIVEETVYADQYTEKVIRAPMLPLHLDYEQQEAMITKATDFHKDLAVNGSVPTYTCDDREPGSDDPTDAMQFFPVFAADVSEANPTATYSGKCFEEI